MTFLEFLITQYLGIAERFSGEGESYWHCPECTRIKFHTMPSHPRYKHRAKCFVCNFGGDVWDMLRFFHPEEHWADHKERLKEIRKDWKMKFPNAFLSEDSSGRLIDLIKEPNQDVMHWYNLSKKICQNENSFKEMQDILKAINAEQNGYTSRNPFYSDESLFDIALGESSLMNLDCTVQLRSTRGGVRKSKM